MFYIIVKEVKELVTNKKIWLGLLLVLIISIIGTSYNTPKEDKLDSTYCRLGIINRDDSAYSKLLLSYFYNNESFQNFITIVEGEEEEIRESYQRGELDVYLEIPKDFADNMMRLEHSPVKVTLNSSDPTKAIIVQNVLKSYEKYIASVEVNAVGLYELMKTEGWEQTLIDDTNRALSMDLIFTALGKDEFFDYQPVSQFPTTTLINYYLASVIVVTTFYIGLYQGYKLLKEMNQGTFLRVRTTKTSLSQMILGKVLVSASVLTILVFIIVAFCLHRTSITTVYYSFALGLFSVCQATLLCALFRTQQSFILMGNLLLFYLAIIGGGIVPIQFLPLNLLLLSKLTPFYYFLKSILYLQQGQFYNLNPMLFGLVSSAILFLLMSMLLMSHHRRKG